MLRKMKWKTLKCLRGRGMEMIVEVRKMKSPSRVIGVFRAVGSIPVVEGDV